MSNIISFDSEKCYPWLNNKGCNFCLLSCPLGVFLSVPQPFPLKPGKSINYYKIFVAQPALCNGCHCCEKCCPSGAIKIKRTQYV